MALPATVRRFTIAIADADREIYDELDVRVAQHPSESERYLVTRVLARALEHGEGWSFSTVSDDEPALLQRDLRGDITAWVEVGAPSDERLHKAGKASPRVVIYTWKPLEIGKVYGADRLEIVQLPPELLDGVAATLQRNNRWDLSRTGGVIYLSIGELTFEADLSSSTAASASSQVGRI